MAKSTNKVTLKRSLSNHQIQLIALGGTIGTGLFLGISQSILAAGPAILLVYALIGIMIYFFMRALGELVVSDSTKQTYIDYVEHYLGVTMGKVTGWLYWLSWLTMIVAEMTAVGLYFRYWWPHLPVWLPGVVITACLLVINLISAQVFGNMEFGLALVKIMTVLAFIVVVIVLVLKRPQPLGTLQVMSKGPFFAHGAHGFLQALQMVIFSFIGIEILGLTAAETKDPAHTLPRAINRIPIRIMLFYIGAIGAILLAQPWQRLSPNESPFVQIFQQVGIQRAADVMNVVVISAAVSAANSFLYSAGRLLFSVTLHQPGRFNRYWSTLSSRQVPTHALVVSALLSMLGGLVAVVFPGNFFTFIAASATSMFILIWLILMVTHVVFLSRQEPSVYPVPGGRFADYGVLVGLGVILIILLILPAYRWPTVTALVLFGVVYGLIRQRSDQKK